MTEEPEFKGERTLVAAHSRIVDLIKRQEEEIAATTINLVTLTDKIATRQIPPIPHNGRQIGTNNYTSQWQSLQTALQKLKESLSKMKEEEAGIKRMLPLEERLIRHEKLIIEERDRLIRNRIQELEQQYQQAHQGYIIIDLPDSQKSLLHDLLKGFEDYARSLTHGYGLMFSVENSVPNKFAFKFTLQEGSPKVPVQQVQNDFAEYCEAVEKGEPLHKPPEGSSPKQQQLYLLMSNRIIQLNAECKMTRNLILSQESIIKQLTSGAISIISNNFPMPKQQALLQSGQGNQAVQGHKNKLRLKTKSKN